MTKEELDSLISEEAISKLSGALKDEEVEESSLPGDLKDEKLNDFHSEEAISKLPGASIKNVKPKLNLVTVEEIKIADIKFDPILPEYMDKTDVKLPMVLKYEDSPYYYCIEGSKIIEEAGLKEAESVECQIIHRKEEFSEVNVAIFKVKIRISPQIKGATYAENVRNIAILKQILMESSENPITYSHGGDRKSNEFQTNREDGVLDLLSSTLGLTKKTLSKYLSHAEYLSKEALDKAIKLGISKHSFEMIQGNIKRSLINELRLSLKDEDSGQREKEIMKEVSNAVIRALDTYDPGKEEFENITQGIKEKFRDSKPKEFKQWSGDKDDENEDPLTEEERYSELIEVFEEAILIAKEKRMSIKEISDFVVDKLTELI